MNARHVDTGGVSKLLQEYLRTRAADLRRRLIEALAAGAPALADEEDGAAALAAAVRAVDTYHPARGSLSRWHRACVRMALREARREAELLPRGARRRGAELVGLEHARRRAASGGSAEARAEVAGLLERTPARARYAVEQHHLRGRTYRDVAQDLGLSAGRVGQIVRAWRAWARRQLERSDG